MASLDEILESKFPSTDPSDTNSQTGQQQEESVTQDSSSSTPSNEGLAVETTDAPPLLEASPETAAAPSIDNLQKKLATEQKKFNDLQSDMDRRVNNAVKPLQAKLEQLTDFLLRQQQYSQQQSPMQQGAEPLPEIFENLDPASRAALEKYLDARVEKTAREKLGYDPEKQELTNVHAAFVSYRSRHPDSVNYDFLIAPLLNEFVEIDPKVDRNWDRLYNWANSFVKQVLSTVPPQGAVSGNGVNQKPSEKPSIGGQLTPDQRSELEKRAQLLKQTEGVSVGSAPSRGKLSLEAIIEKNLDNPVRR